MRRFVGLGRTAAQVALLAVALAACKSGGGGGGSPPPPPAGSFTISTSNLTFSAKFTAAPPLPQSVAVTLNGTVAAVGAGYAPGVAPASWLAVAVTGSGLQWSFAFSVNTTVLAPGTYTTTVTIGTADANGTILQTRDVQVTYIIRDGVRITSAPPVLSGVAGSSQSGPSFQLNVEAPAGVQWQLSSSQPWLQPPTGTRTGNLSLTVTADTSTLPPGQATATLTVTNTADPTDTATLLVTASMSAPVLTTTLSQITLGGDSGLDMAPVSLGFALGTGANAYPWTLATTPAGSWLTVSSAAGTVASSNVTVTVDANRSQLAPGIYTGHLLLQALVNNVGVVRTIPVELRLEANRLLVSDLGVAFSSFPSRQVLTRTLAVRNTRGETGVPWQATANQPWLQATLTGNTGDPLVLTANPTGLAAGQYFATVTVISPSTAIVNTETVRVGLTVGTTDPQSQIDFPLAVRFYVVENPVEPEVFVTDSVTIEAYNVYTGAWRTLPWTGGTAGGLRNLAMSADGASLYVIDDRATGDRIVELDPVSGTERRSFAFGTDAGFAAQGIAYARPDAHPVLLTTYYGDIFDVATGALFAARINTPLFDDHAIDVSSDQRYVYTLNTSLSPSTIYRYGIRYSSLTAGGLSTERLGERSGALETPYRDHGYDIAVSSSDTIYLAAANPPQFDTVAPDTLARTGFLAATYFPNNVETCWNGLVAGGTENGPSGVDDIWVYGAASTPPQLDSGTGSLMRRTLKFSGDCTRLVSASGAGLRIQNAPAP